ncbi:MAG: hypothetical protein ACRDJE_06720 [Dehalococcoidia bacterium]
MAREIVAVVPLSHTQTMSLLLQAAEALQHQVVRFDADQGDAMILVDFTLRALATFRVQAEAQVLSTDETRLRLIVRPAFRLTIFTGVGQSERIGWELIGRMQQILNPTRYRELEDEVLPSRTQRVRRLARPPMD